MIFSNSELGHTTKTKTQDDTVLLDSLDRDYAPGLLKMIFQCKRSSKGPLFPSLTLANYEAAFRTAKQQIGLGHLQLTPHAVRHSGPSIDALHRSRSAAEIQNRGRWRCAKSIQRYQKPGQMLAKMSRVPQHVWDNAKQALPQVLHKLQRYYGAKA